MADMPMLKCIKFDFDWGSAFIAPACKYRNYATATIGVGALANLAITDSTSSM